MDKTREQRRRPGCCVFVGPQLAESTIDGYILTFVLQWRIWRRQDDCSIASPLVLPLFLIHSALCETVSRCFRFRHTYHHQDSYDTDRFKGWSFLRAPVRWLLDESNPYWRQAAQPQARKSAADNCSNGRAKLPRPLLPSSWHKRCREAASRSRLILKYITSIWRSA